MSSGDAGGYDSSMMATTTLSPSKDAMIDSANGSTNYGSQTTAKCGKQLLTKWRYLLEFPISLKRVQKIGTATLRLYETTGAASAETAEVERLTKIDWTNGGVSYIHRVISSLSWDVQGGDLDATGRATFSLRTSIGAITVDVTDLALDAINARSGICSLCVKRVSETGANALGTFATQDNATAGNRPTLVLTHRNKSPRSRASARSRRRGRAA